MKVELTLEKDSDTIKYNNAYDVAEEGSYTCIRFTKDDKTLSHRFPTSTITMIEIVHDKEDD